MSKKMNPVISIAQVKKSFQEVGRRVEVLRGINFEVNQGTSMAIVGKSGSGKSTLLSLLAGLDDPDEGELKILGNTWSQLSERERAHFRMNHIGIVFQQFHLLEHLSALENIALPLEIAKKSEIQKAARDALALVGLNNRASHRPSQLSGGECQRVAIARALVMNPDIILADEPSGNLDSETGAMVMDQLFDLISRQQKTLVLVTHSDELAARCDRRMRLLSGQAISE